MKDVEKELIIELLENREKKKSKGLYSLIISVYDDLIKSNEKNGVSCKMIVRLIEKDLEINYDTINYNSFYRALERKHSKDSKDKSFSSKPKKVEKKKEIDNINLDISGESTTPKNRFD